MPIEFHCVHCQHLIRTGDEHAGKRGKCPFCHQSVYIPTPRDQLEPLDLAPLDADEERERERAMRETRELTQSILRDKEKQGETGPRPSAGASSAARPPARPAHPPAPAVAAGGAGPDVETLVVDYAVCMFDGDLDEARALASQIAGQGAAAERVIQRLMMDEVLPKPLARIPRAILNGYLKKLGGG